MPGSGRMSRCEVGRSQIFLAPSRMVGRWAQGASHALLNLIRTPCSVRKEPLASIPCLHFQCQTELTSHSPTLRLNYSHATIFCFFCGPCNHLIRITHGLICATASPHTLSPLLQALPQSHGSISQHNLTVTAH